MCVASGEMQHLDGLEPEGSDAVEDPFAGPEQDRGDVEPELVDDAGDERLPNGGGAARDALAVVRAVSRACAWAASKPSVTKRKVVPSSISIGSLPRVEPPPETPCK